MKYLLFFFLLISSSYTFAQTGCTDPEASNYNSSDLVNDGSCTYPATYHYPVLKALLPSTLSESSGLVWTDGKLWTHNDSGDEAAIYQVDTGTGQVIQKVIIDNFPNNDWEDITADSSYLYIGDMGNNNGTRTNLKVLRVAKDSIGSDAVVHVNAEAISFSYADQLNFASSSTHNFDCEGIAAGKEYLYLFTKNRGDQQTKLYRLPKTPGSYSITPYSAFNVNGLITGADYSPATNEIVLIGYAASYTQSFLWFLNDFQADSFFSGNKRRIELGTTPGWQTEAISFLPDGRFLLSCETQGITDASLYTGTKDWLPVVAGMKNEAYEMFKVSPNPTRDMIRLTNTGKATVYVVYDTLNRKVLEGKFGNGERMIDLQSLTPSVYVIELSGSGEKKALRVTKQ